MTDREKLVALLERFSFSITVNGETLADWNIPMQQIKKALADHLLANGVRLETKQGTSEKTSEWISAEERLPEDDVQVWACTKHGKAFSAHCEKGKWRVSHSVKITHWMPLPERPNDSER